MKMLIIRYLNKETKEDKIIKRVVSSDEAGFKLINKYSKGNYTLVRATLKPINNKNN